MAKVVGVSGAQGAGKTTLLEGLKAAGFTVDDFKVSRAVQRSLGWETLHRVMDNVETMVLFQEEIARQKMDRDSELGRQSGTLILTERTFADIHAYATFWAWEHVDRGSWSFDEAARWLTNYSGMCRAAQEKLYSGLILLPLMPEVRWQSDPHRASLESSGEIFNDIESFCRHHSQAVTLTSANSFERIRQARMFLESL